MGTYRSRYKPPGYNTARLVLVPAIAALLAIGSACGPDENSSAPAPVLENSPQLADNLSESIQLSPCQRSAAACFESGGLGTLTDNLDGLAIDPVTGRFCFSFQEGCRR